MYAIVICDNGSIKTYSINGQLLKSININAKFIELTKDPDLHDLVYYLDDDKVVLLSTPDLRALSELEIK